LRDSGAMFAKTVVNICMEQQKGKTDEKKEGKNEG
jgi:hypothetical protein